MKTSRSELLKQLTAQVEQNIARTLQLLIEPVDTLITRPAHDAWSVVEIIAHLNSYNDHYLPAIKACVNKGKRSTDPNYRSSLPGEYFVRMMQPVNGEIARKHKAATKHWPLSQISIVNVNKYIRDQKILLDLLQRSASTDLIRNKVPVSIAPFIKLRLGDVYRFLIVHQQRHFVQIVNNLKMLVSA